MESQRAECFRSWIGSGKKILDMGCRDGQLTRYFIEDNQVTGVDIDQSALEYASENYGITVEQVNLNETLPFPDACFDVVVLAEVLEHLPYPLITLAEIYRMLRPNGLFVGNIPLAYHVIDRWKVLRGKKLSIAGDKTHLQFFKYSEVLSLLSEFFITEKVYVFKGGKLGSRWPDLFARNIGFYCRKLSPVATYKT